MTVDRIIVSSDQNSDYLQFWPLVSIAWRRLTGAIPTLAFIGEERVNTDVGDVIRIPTPDGIPTSFAAQAVRLFIPTLFPDQVCLISDLDMLPLQSGYFLGNASAASNHNLVIYSADAYPPSAQRYPMCYIAAKGHVFREILGIAEDANTEDILATICSWHSEGLGWPTDELMFGRHMHLWSGYPNRCIMLRRSWTPLAANRIDRVSWEINLTKLKQNGYIDAHLLRPMHKHLHQLAPLIRHLGIDTCEIGDFSTCQWLLSATHSVPFGRTARRVIARVQRSLMPKHRTNG